MNTVELAHRLTRHLSVADVGTLTARQRQELSGEITAGLMEYYENVPDVWSRTTFSHRIPPSRTVSAEVINGSSLVSNEPFLESDRGRSVVFGGNVEEWNEITATGQVLDTYPGTTGTVNATIYPDCISIRDVVIKRIVGDPYLHNNGWTLARDERINTNGDFRRYWNYSGWRRFGTPVRYAIEHGGQSQGSDLVFLMRIDPIPTVEEVIRFDADFYPDPVTFGDISEPRDIPVSDGHANLILIPLIESRLIGCSMWNGSDRAERRIDEASNRARIEMQRIIPDFGRINNRVRTKPGY